MKNLHMSYGFAVIQFIIALILILAVGVSIFIALNHHPEINLKPTPTQAPSPSSSLQTLRYSGSTSFTGVFGTVGSTGCPAQQVNHPCPVTPVSGIEVSAVSAVAQNTNTFKATTDTTGSFQLTLPPGSYSLSAKPTGNNAFPSCKQSSAPVTVANGAATRYDFVCSNGIE